jgi:hypothetical protein
MISLDVQPEAPLVKGALATPRALDRLPPSPIVAVRLIQLFANPDVHITEIDRIISVEPVFTARALQMANSPLFARRARSDQPLACYRSAGTEPGEGDYHHDGPWRITSRLQ